MKYSIIGLNFLVENPQAPWNISPLVTQTAPQENKVPVPPFFKNASKFLGLPCRKGGGHYGHISEGWLFLGRFRVESLPRMIHKEMLAQFIYKPT